jgi:hypothetical protein
MIPPQNQYSSLNRCPGCGGFVEGQAECLACGREAKTEGFDGLGSDGHFARPPGYRVGPRRDPAFDAETDDLIASVLPPEPRSTQSPVAQAPVSYAPVDMVGAAIRRQLREKAASSENDPTVASDRAEADAADDQGGPDDAGIPREQDIFLGRPPDRLQRVFWRANKFIDG